MAEHTTESIPSLIRSLLSDARDLIREELALAKAELREEASAARSVAIAFAAAAVVALIGLVLLSVALGGAVADLFNLPGWAGLGIVGVVMAIVAFVLVGRGRAQLTNIRGLPRTQETLRENITWMQSKSSSR
jgi:MFS family permease